MEPCITTNLGSLAGVAVHYNSRRVVVHRLIKAAVLVRLLSQPMPPHTAEACDRYQHVLPASQPTVVVALGVEPLLQIVDMRHQLGIRAPQVGRWLRGA